MRFSLILGYLIPYHPYPFPRYSRLTPAHFASLPTLNARRFFGKQPSNRPYPPSSTGSSPGGCHCCSTSQSYTTSRDSYLRGNLAACSQASCSDFLPNKSRRGLTFYLVEEAWKGEKWGTTANSTTTSAIYPANQVQATTTSFQPHPQASILQTGIKNFLQSRTKTDVNHRVYLF